MENRLQLKGHGTVGELKTVSAWTVPIDIDFFFPVNFLSILNITKDAISQDKRPINGSSFFFFQMEKNMRAPPWSLQPDLPT